MIKRLRVREGNTGILYLTDAAGKEERYIPDYNFDSARELLLEFEHLQDEKGRLIKDNYWRNGNNWFPTMVTFLHGQLFYPYVKYKPLIDNLIDGKVKFDFLNKAEFYRIVSTIERTSNNHSLKKWVFGCLVALNNWLVLRRYRPELLFFRFTPDDFRTLGAKRVFDDLKVQYVEVLAPTRQLLLGNLFRRGPYYFYGGTSVRNLFRYSYRLNEADAFKKTLFDTSIRNLELKISSSLIEYHRHRAALAGKSFKVFYGIDDTQIVYPVLYACQHLGIKTITHQHGAAYNSKLAGYVMEGFQGEEYKWFERVIVWGKYWKHLLLKLSKIYTDEMVVEGASLFEFDYAPLQDQKHARKNILVPYEFLTNTFKVGKYIMKFLDMGYAVFFKPRPDENVLEQLEAYCLDEDHRARINIVEQITPRFMETIDIVAGTMTSLVYQLLPYSKTTWILETELGYLDHLVEEGLAHKVRYEDLENLDETYFSRTSVHAEDFFDPESLEDTLRKHVLRYLSQPVGQHAKVNETFTSLELPRKATSQ